MSARLQNVCTSPNPAFGQPLQGRPESGADLDLLEEPERGIEPLTYALRERRSAV